ncbi:MAG: hypothetical protein AAGE98_01090 [Actinomycetota bacterium]
MTTTTSPDLVAEHYEPLVAAAREAFFASETVRLLSDPTTDADLLDQFLIHYCALGTQMTRPVDGWIRRAGAACIERGHVELGEALQRHADHEAGHDQMMVVDTHTLVERWNGANPSRPLDAEALLSMPATPGVADYVDLHEDVIVSPEPFAQLAIEYEIELLSVTAGPMLIGNVGAVCGPDRVQGLTFLNDHIAIDEGHTVFNRRQLNTFLAAQPAAVGTLGIAGVGALEAFRSFLDDCVVAARAVLA